MCELSLSCEQRNLLRLHLIAGLGIDRLGPMFQVHRAIMARRLQAAREAVLDETVRLLKDKLGISTDQVRSLARALRSQVDVSLCTLLVLAAGDSAPACALAVTDPAAAAPQQRIFAPGQMAGGRYRIQRFLAQGGMGEVYQAHDVELDQPVALKTLRPAMVADPQMLRRFRREILLARSVAHPNVCRIFDLGLHREPGRETVSFLTMELLSGQTLSRRLREHGRLDPEQALPLVRQMAAALDAAHAAGIVHRDFKSENVFLEPTADGGVRVVVTDFGLARREAQAVDGSLSAQPAFVGTPAYMAPEQVRGGLAGPPADLYSLGVVMYELLTGERPFTGRSPLDVAMVRLLALPLGQSGAGLP